MLKVNTSAKFRRDLRICAKRGYDLQLLENAVNLPDWLLIYRVSETNLYLARTGTHSDLFGE